MENQVKPLSENANVNDAENKALNANKPMQKTVKPAKSAKMAADFKRKYFDYYDDVKDHTKGREDW